MTGSGRGGISSDSGRRGLRSSGRRSHLLLTLLVLLGVLSAACRTMQPRPPVESVTVVIDTDGSIFLRNQPVSIDGLENKLTELGDEHTRVVISMKLNTPFKYSRKVMELLDQMRLELERFQLHAGD